MRAARPGLLWRTVLVILGICYLGSDPGAVVLHPGTITGNAGLTGLPAGLTFYGGYVQMSNPIFSGSGAVTDAVSPFAFTEGGYSMTVESDQTYSSVFETLYINAPNSGYFQLNRYDLSVNVPLNGAATRDLTTGAGAIQIAPIADLPPVAAGITLVSTDIQASAYASEGLVGYQASVNGSGSVLLPMGATAATIYTSGIVNFVINDPMYGDCTIRRDIPFDATSQLAGLSAGVTTTLPLDHFDLTDETCAPGSFDGTIDLTMLPADPTEVNVASRITGFFYPGWTLSPFSMLSASPYSTSLPNPYSLELPPGTYYSYLEEKFGAPYQSTLHLLPNDTQPVYTEFLSSGSLTAAQLTIKGGKPTPANYLYGTGTVSGNVQITGPLAARSFVGNLRFDTDYNVPPTAPDPALPNSGHYGLVDVNGPVSSVPYGAVLTRGPWVQSFFAYVSDAFGTNSLSVFDPSTSLPVETGDAKTQDFTLETSEGDVVFDVIEPPGSPTVLISSPSVSIYVTNALTGRSTSAFAQSNAVAQATPSVHVIGPPGKHLFSAFGTVNGSSTSFATGEIDLGHAVDTPAGDDEDVPLLNGDGDPLNLDLNFEHVTAGGVTTGSITDVGPAPPGGFLLVKKGAGKKLGSTAFGEKTFLTINTTATFSGKVRITLHYDPTGMSLRAQRKLRLMHYNCVSACFWEDITDNPAIPGNPSPNPNTTDHTVSGTTTSFSVFALMVPAIEWADPADIVYGTPLSSVQLNAVGANADDTVDGTLTYTPPDGTVLHAGADQILAVEFTPTDTETFGPASAQVLINVLPAALTLTAEDKTRTEDEANPLLTVAYSGFVNADDPSSLSALSVLDTTATGGSPVGTYPITFQAPTPFSSDYNILFVPGTLTVTPGAETSDPNGRMHGNGHLGNGRRHDHFVFRVAQRGDRERGRFEYWESDPRGCQSSDHEYERDNHWRGDDDHEYGRNHRNTPNHFEATSITEVTFSDDPGWRPGRRARPKMDTVLFKGTGTWNGRKGYTFEVRATDQGEPGKGKDTLSLVIRSAGGTIVANISSALAGGNIESSRLRN